jgi:hypothetical protein
MGYRYDMQNKSAQAQAIVRQREKADELAKKHKTEEIKCNPSTRNGDYESVMFTKGTSNILELRISGTAIVTENTKLSEVDIHKWLCSVGSSFVDQVKSYETILITSNDVQDQKLVTSWKKLNRVNLESE